MNGFEVIELGGIKTVTTQKACNHVAVIDTSGSMYHDLPSIRKHLKNIISVVAKPEDTFSVIYFSGKNQCGIVFEDVLVSNTATVTMMHQAIDRHLTPKGMTCFVDPIDLALTLDVDPSKVNNFIMMTDGYDNSSKKSDILESVKKLSGKFHSVSFIEYGYYADRDLLAKMAESVNGTHIFADGVVSYENALEKLVSNTVTESSIEVDVNKKAKHCIYVINNKINIITVNDGVAVVPESVTKVYSIMPNDILSKHLSEEHLYLVLYYAAKTTNSKLIMDCLQALGDVSLFNLYQNAFTKQELSIFEIAAEGAALDPNLRYVDGKDLNIVPDKNAKTVVDLLDTLSKTTGVKLITSSPLFKYKSIGRKSTYENELPKFIPNPDIGVNMNKLVFNSERPNVSINTVINGTIELPENEFSLESVDSHIFRNYTIIRDGILNVNELPVTIPTDNIDILSEFPNHKVLSDSDNSVYVSFDLTKMPVINRKMVESVCLDDYIEIVASLETAKANLKVVNDMTKDSGDKSAGLKDIFGEEQAAWLSSIGIRDYGFSKVGGKSEEVSDEYESIHVISKIKGLSSLPSIKAVQTKIELGKKLNIGDRLIANALNFYAKFDENAISEVKKDLTIFKRGLEALLAHQVYALVLGRQWFGDTDVIETEVELDGSMHTLTIEKVRKMIKM